MGTKDNLYLINRDEIDDITFETILPTGLNRLVISMTLLASKYIYKIEGRNNSNEPSATLRKGRYFDTYEHKVAFKVFDNGPETKSQLESMIQKGNLVAVIENNYRGGGDTSAFEIYGFNAGLEITECSRVINDNDTQGAYSLVLKTPEQQGEPHLPYSLLAGDYTGTKVMLNGLLTP
ncbi:MAG: hypothetical protein M0D57_21055 [Sphingobacteriales bacterium JAD_PAG50586_3]|nr:MAG: hypothetical protein M0D57_21055 [Sphingobacteriales bacterium JAD_PAG50586_3]